MKKGFTQHHKGTGFTLIELLVVIAIIGILSAIGLVSLNGAREKARDAQGISDLGQMRTALALYYDDNSSLYPGQLRAAGANCLTLGSEADVSTTGADDGIWSTGGKIIGPSAYLGNELKPPSANSNYYYCANNAIAATDTDEYVLFYQLENGPGTYYYSIMEDGTVTDFSDKDTTVADCTFGAASDECSA
ncbi:MAG: hypothetical protein UY81_C0016G0003 [Candidatus Giovannonibacteria bacterium GW2011_GWA2_53_7]|uniref:General secretion pathway protein G n=1 Tax=Candidatus Giovannonibacteria bacterium GW2011_GWA2_53_7 TaxID=1618650 RepID=A0A0G1XZV6_9BACT|nr:MAG: hypothetical protein UY81_C0016G0003 [Candidatus Giovannonibacteria bacterium GW2011_GWA2_53_7]